MNSRTEILRLLPCDPTGPLRESHSSLIIRTAEENDTSPALLLDSKYYTGKGAALSKGMGLTMGQSLNGLGSRTANLVKRTEELTKLSNIRASTTLAFSKITTTNGLLRPGLAWSPEQLNCQKPKYYPLLYALDAVRVCLISKKPLFSLCSQCRNPLPNMSGACQIAVCSKCRASLAQKRSDYVVADPVGFSVKNLEFENWVAQQLGDFIVFQTNQSLDEILDLSDTLNYWFRKFEIPRSTVGARSLGVSQAALSIWLSNRTMPKLRTTLGLCWVFGLSLHEFLNRKLPANHDGKLRLPAAEVGVRRNAHNRRRIIDKAELHYKLTNILRENQSALLSFEEICKKRFNRSSGVVRKCFPDHARQIANRYLSNRQLFAEIRREQYCATIKTVARFLHSRNIIPNHKTMRQYLDQPARLRCAWAIAALREVRSELGFEDDGEQLLLPV